MSQQINRHWSPEKSELSIPNSWDSVVYVNLINDHTPFEEDIRTIIFNLSELTNWAAFFHGYRNRGIINFHPLGEGLTFPPNYLQGRDLANLPCRLLNDIEDYNQALHFFISFSNVDERELRVYKWTPLDAPQPFKKSGLSFPGPYTQADDQIEVYESSDPLFCESKAAFEIGDYNKSLAILNQVIKKNPYYSRAFSARGQIYLAFQDYRFALANYFDALEINPLNWRALYNCGRLFWKVQQDSLAIDYMHEAIEINKEFVECIQRLAAMYHVIGQIDDSIRVLNEGLEANRGSDLLEGALSVCLEEKKSETYDQDDLMEAEWRTRYHTRPAQ